MAVPSNLVQLGTTGEWGDTSWLYDPATGKTYQNKKTGGIVENPNPPKQFAAKIANAKQTQQIVAGGIPAPTAANAGALPDSGYKYTSWLQTKTPSQMGTGSFAQTGSNVNMGMGRISEGAPGELRYITPQDLLLKNTLNTQAVEALRGQALAAPGQSAWEKMALGQQALEQRNLTDAAARQQLSSTAQARSQLASRGGLSSGASERLAMGGSRNLMMARQQAANQGALSRAGIGLSAEQQRQATLAAMPGIEQQVAASQMGTEQFNIQNRLNELKMQEAAKLAKYQEEMKLKAAERQATAISASAPEQGIIGGLLGGIF